MVRLEMASISNSSLFPTAIQPPRSQKTIKKYPSLSRMSAISSTASQVSRISSISSSSWHSAATGMASLGSTAATSTSQSEDVAPYAPSSQGGSTVKIPGPHSPDSEYSPTSISSLSNAASPSQRFRQSSSSPRISLPPPLSPPPVSALPSPPGPRMPNPSSSTRSDSPVHSLNSEFSDRLNISLHQLQQLQQQQQQQEPCYHPHRQQSLANPPSFNQHPDYPSPHSPLPPRPPRNQNRPHSPEITTRHLEQPRTPPQTPSVLQPTHDVPPQITPTSSGRSFSGLRLPFSRSHTYPSPTPASAPQASASSSHSHHIHSPHLYPSQATQLMYVREEEERLVLEPEGASHRHDERALHDNADIEDEGEPDYITHSHADDHSFMHDQHHIKRGNDGRSDIASHHDDSDQGSYVGSQVAHGGEGGRSIWSPYTSFLPSLVTAPGGGNSAY